jgi:hypothetical protein
MFDTHVSQLYPAVPLQEPVDQEVVIGRNASFQCLTRSKFTRWMILDRNILIPIELYSSMLLHTIHEENLNESTTKSTLLLTTSEWTTNLSIVCFYDPNCTRTAHLVGISCLGNSITAPLAGYQGHLNNVTAMHVSDSFQQLASHMIISPFAEAVPTEHLVVMNATLYYGHNETVVKILFEVSWH